jgi:hypothetical protein
MFMKRVLCLLLCLIWVLGLAGCGFFSQPEPQAPVVDSTPEPEPEPEPEPPKYLNPLTGEYSRDTEYAGRPFAVSINNIEAGLPQSGVSMADIVVEIETEGGITRLMCLFTEPEKAADGLGSIRSLRHQFLGAVYQWNPVVVHIGTSNYTTDYIWARGIVTMNGYYSDDFIYVNQARRAGGYASEHTKYTDAEHLAIGMDEFDLSGDWNPTSPTAFPFHTGETSLALAGGTAQHITYAFSRAYDGDFRFDAASEKYLKFQHGEPHIDAGNNNAQLAFDNVLVLFAPVSGLYGELIDVDYSAGGEGFYFNGGRYEHFSWTKDGYDQDFVFTKDDGSPLVLNPGTTHLGVVRASLRDSLGIDQPEEVLDSQD